jgi:tetratricopeptide (TPR) repeat protein
MLNAIALNLSRYTAAVFSLPLIARAFVGLGVLACTACAGLAPKSDAAEAPQAFYTVTAEIALSRHEPRVAALEYAAAAETDRNEGLLRRATEVTAQCLQPSLTLDVARRWVAADPASVDAHRAVAKAALDLHKIEQSAAHYRVVLTSSPRGPEAEFAVLETELAATDNIYGARQLADRLAGYFPGSTGALRLQAYAAMRADDPAAAVRSFRAALASLEAAGATAGARAGTEAAADATAGARTGTEAAAGVAAGRDGDAGEEASTAANQGTAIEDATRREMTQGLRRARILSGDVDEPLAQAKLQADGGDGKAGDTAVDDKAARGAAANGTTATGKATREKAASEKAASEKAASEKTASNTAASDRAASRMNYALLLLAAQQTDAARARLVALTQDALAAPAALRLLGLVDLQEGKLDDAGFRFAELLTSGKFLDDALYYLGVIAERRGDLERALRFYAQVQNGENAVPTLLRAAAILRAHGAAPAAEGLFDRLVEEQPLRAPELLAARARIYSEAGDMPQAAAVLERAVLQYPDSVELRYAAASLAEERGQVSAALRELKAVVKDRPDDPAALNAYGFTLADHNRRLTVAHRLIEQAYASAPRNAAILDSFGWVLFRQGRGEQALPYLNAAYADDRGGDIAAHLGEVLWRLGRRAEAERIWAEGGRVDAGNRLLKSTRVRLHASN